MAKVGARATKVQVTTVGLQSVVPVIPRDPAEKEQLAEDLKASEIVEAAKDTAGYGYDAASDTTKDAAKAGLEISSEGAEKVQGTADAKHEEL